MCMQLFLYTVVHIGACVHMWRRHFTKVVNVQNQFVEEELRLAKTTETPYGRLTNMRKSGNSNLKIKNDKQDWW